MSDTNNTTTNITTATLIDSITNEVHGKLSHRCASMAPGHMGAMPSFSYDLIASVVKTGIDFAVQNGGPILEAATVAEKSYVEKIVSDASLDYFSNLISKLKTTK